MQRFSVIAGAPCSGFTHLRQHVKQRHIINRHTLSSWAVVSRRRRRTSEAAPCVGLVAPRSQYHNSTETRENSSVLNEDGLKLQYERSETAQPTSEEQLPENSSVAAVELSIGRLSIGRLRPDEVAAISVLVTRAFSGSPEAFTFREIRNYIEELSEDPQESLVLVGRLTPSDASITLAEGATQRLAGVVMISFVASTREQFPSLQPSPHHAYISNTAVDASLQRKGVGRVLLEAAESACKAEGHEAVTLHVRLADGAALQLYEQMGYTEVERDGWSLTRRYRPRALLIKRLSR